MSLENRINFVKENIKDQYLADNRPWIIGYSGGKDSTAMMQIIWKALEEIPEKKRKKELHVLSNNTLVENPLILRWIDENLEYIEKAAINKNFPIKTVKVTPHLNDTFWVNLIGRGYPAPLSNFRWCTERLKINPTSKYIKDKIDSIGEVIILLGTRLDESSTRRQTIMKYQISNNRLKRHPYLDLALIFSPIQALKNSDIWEFLKTNKCQWEVENEELIALYKHIDEDDITLVLDKKIPPSGNSRFGCWVCTLVDKDKSMQAFVDDGDEWMRPLLEFRDWIKENRNKDEYRMNRRRNGNLGKGPYTIDKRVLLLRKLLIIQKQIKFDLITDQELKAIQTIWQLDGFHQNVYFIIKEINEIKESNEMAKNDEVKEQHRSDLKDICLKHDVDINSLEKLILEEKNKSLSVTKKSIQTTILEEMEK
ncbi:MAG: DNA phosphorothioation system sulfurtransferase DndC [Candidatus Lokiarchaeota archaeon]|nr:DNA phosphorothioation system sulfurtransferase DndC [Candidatus Lokiarchaeota archaeon]